MPWVPRKKGSGIPASGIPAMGVGTGGAKFQRMGVFTPGAGHIYRRDERGRAMIRLENEERERLKLAALRKLQAIMDRPEAEDPSPHRDMVTLNAANSVLNRLDGMPKQTVETPRPAEHNDERANAAHEAVLARLAAIQPEDAAA